MKSRVIVIGGGFSGLAAGVHLADHGYEITLLEQRGSLGGRAYSFRDQTSNEIIDNGQHLFMGCYHQTLRFLKTIGTLERLYLQPTLEVKFLDPRKGLTHLKLPPLPAPFHLLVGLMGYSGLSLGDKLRMFPLFRSLRSPYTGANRGIDRITVEEWLDRLKQSNRAKQNLWYPIAIATLNDDPRISSATLLQRVLQEAFLGHPDHARLGISTVGLSELYTEAAKSFIEKRGGRILTQSLVTRIHIRSHRVESVELRNGRRLEAEQVISTIPYFALTKILSPETLNDSPFFRGITQLTSSPILSLNLWFDGPIIDEHFIGLLGTQTQWLFNKEKIFAMSGTLGHYLALVFSGAHRLAALSSNEVLAIALKELHELLPITREAKLQHHLLIREKQATFSPTLESSRCRPSHRTPFTNLFLGGDWTDTGLPATIEGAVASGYACADLIMEKG